MKRIVSYALVIFLLLTMTLPVSAAQKEEVELQYTHIQSVYASLTINEATGITTCTGSITAKQYVPVKVYVRLQRYENGYWYTVTSWTVNDTWVAHSTTNYAVYSGYKYRVYTTGYVYDSEGVIQESGSAIHTVNYPSP